jgi:hypothetical protein
MFPDGLLNIGNNVLFANELELRGALLVLEHAEIGPDAMFNVIVSQP